jgi:hypothetical protein
VSNHPLARRTRVSRGAFNSYSSVADTARRRGQVIAKMTLAKYRYHNCCPPPLRVSPRFCSYSCNRKDASIVSHGAKRWRDWRILNVLLVKCQINLYPLRNIAIACLKGYSPKNVTLRNHARLNEKHGNTSTIINQGLRVHPSVHEKSHATKGLESRKFDQDPRIKTMNQDTEKPFQAKK